MADQPVNDSPTEDEPTPPQWPAGVKKALQRPLVVVALVIATGLLIFYLGTRIGDAAGRAFDGDGGAIVAFFSVLTAVVVGVIALGVRLDRRIRERAAKSEG